MKTVFNIPGQRPEQLQKIFFLFQFIFIFVTQYSGDAMTATVKHYTKANTMAVPTEWGRPFFISCGSNSILQYFITIKN